MLHSFLLVQGEARLLDEGQKVWGSMIGLRDKIAEQPSLFETPEGNKLVDEFNFLQKSLEVDVLF